MDRTIVVTLGLTWVIPMLKVVVSMRSHRPGITKMNTEVLDNVTGRPCLNMN